MLSMVGVASTWLACGHVRRMCLCSCVVCASCCAWLVDDYSGRGQVCLPDCALGVSKLK